MERMLAFLPRNSTVELCEVELPRPGIGQVLIRMRASGKVVIEYPA